MIQVNLEKAKGIAHDVRRAVRAELFKPLDVEATIPMYAEQAEAKRAEIREQFAQYQTEIDAAKNVDELKAALMKCKDCA